MNRSQRPKNKRDVGGWRLVLLGHQAPTSVSDPGAKHPSRRRDRHQQREVLAMGLADRHTSERTRR
jgi:hypothetical protein